MTIEEYEKAKKEIRDSHTLAEKVGFKDALITILKRIQEVRPTYQNIETFYALDDLSDYIVDLQPPQK